MKVTHLKNGAKIHKTQFNAWLKALRSGEYKQTGGSLNDYDGFCCLGVACDVLSFTKNYDSKGWITGGLPEDQYYAPKWLKDIDRDFQRRTGRRLSVLNDNEVLDFLGIADSLQAVYIEGVLEDE